MPDSAVRRTGIPRWTHAGTRAHTKGQEKDKRSPLFTPVAMSHHYSLFTNVKGAVVPVLSTLAAVSVDSGQKTGAGWVLPGLLKSKS